MQAEGGKGVFVTTRWSVVLGTRAGESSRAAQALEQLCQTYWYPLYVFLRRNGQSPEDAQDLVQGFFAHLLGGNMLNRIAPEKGRFRSFLLASLKNFLCDQADKANALKRGGGVQTVSLDAATAEERFHLEPQDMLDPAKAYDRRWALMLLESALTRLSSENEGERRKRFDRLRDFMLGDPTDTTYAETGRTLGMSEGAVKVAVLRLRQRYRELVRDEIAETVATPEDVQDELQHIFSVLSA
ncbi:MAG: sigma-70 family RNA polymerase sigma factor [Pedosphaera sp.]|nr:sigma-70 family RNA polymerase sigma factor [Pedosphaera sp.]